MEENKLNLHHGFRFNPFESELINFYLKPKVIGEKLSCNVVEERQLYGPNAKPWQLFDPKNHPWILSEVSSGKFEKIAYAFVNLTKKAANSTNNKSYVGREQYNRKAGCGTWDGQTKRTEIRDSHDNLIGERRMLVFEINEVSDQEDLSRVGHWRMHEYHLCGVNKDIPNLSNTVLCKIILNHSKTPAIKLIPSKTSGSIKASAPEKNKTNTKKLDVVCSSSSTNTAVVDTFEGISKSCEAFTTPCDDDDLEWINSIYDECPPLEKVENGPMRDDDDDLDWINNIFVSKEGEDGNLYINMSQFEFPSYPEHEDEQPPVDVTNNLGKRKLQAETSYEQMHAIGIYSRLDRVFDAPPAVKNVLIGQFGLEYSYIGSKETDERGNEVQILGIMDLWTPDNHYRWSKSRYGDHVSAVVESVNQSRLLLCNVDVVERESLRTRKKELEDAIAELETSLKVLQSEQRQNEDEAAKLQGECEDILSIVQQERKRGRELESRVNQRRSKINGYNGKSHKLCFRLKCSAISVCN